LEGPFITNKGAHPEKYLREPADGVLATYGSLEAVALVTMAPETKGAFQVIEDLSKQNVVVSIGHTHCDFDVALRSMLSGAKLITHLFNAMSAFHHRDPGVVGLLGHIPSEQRPFYTIIVDGIHTHPTSVAIAYSAHPDGAILITDAISAMGLQDGAYMLGSQNVQITDGKATLLNNSSKPSQPRLIRSCSDPAADDEDLSETKETLAGAVTTMDECLRKFMQFTGADLVPAVRAASTNPARCLGLSNKGSLAVGCDADLVLLTTEGFVKGTVIMGELAEGYDDTTIRIRYNNRF
jgi:N-acetylglucosamine-6-phosphate deacetylase